MFYQNVSEPFLLNVRRYPWKTAVVFRDERLTYDGLNRRINRVANALLQLGVSAGEKVAYMFPNCIELVEIYYAIQKIGAAAVPLDFRLNPQEIAFLADHCDAETLLFSSEFLDKVRLTRGGIIKTRRLIPSEAAADFSASLQMLARQAGEEEPSIFLDAAALSRIQFTGGSTGVPRGVMRTHEADLAELVGEMLYNKIGADADQVVLIQCPLGHHGGHSWYTATLCSGGTLVICDAFDPEKILSQIQRERVTYMLLLPPSTYLRLCDSPLLKRYDVSSVRLVQSAAGYTTPEIVLRISDAFPNSEIYYGWGQTESGLGTSLVLTREMAEKRLPRIQSVGRAMPFLEIRIVDEEGNELAVGEVGEGEVRSPAVMSGYYGQPELTAAVLGADGWLRTGDIMRMDSEGYVYMLSRKKDMIKSGGENVFAQEVEGVIMEHPAVAQCVITGVEDEVFGEGVLAIVQLRCGHSLTLEELQAHCKNYISSHKKPRYLEFVESFDMNDAGKIRKTDLCQKYKSLYRERIRNKEKTNKE